MAQYAGVTTVASMFDVLEAKLPTKSELRQASLGNDCVSTRLFIRIIEAFIKHALGIDPKTKQAMPFRGLFGKVQAYFGMVETQGRGTLHIHFLIWLSNCPTNSVQVDKLMRSPEGDRFRESVRAYAESIVSNTIPLNIETGSCHNCGASYSNLVGLDLDARARLDPCAGLFSAKAGKRVLEPLLVQCGECNTKFSSQHVLRQVLLENRQVIPAWESPLSQTGTLEQAQVELRCRNDLSEAIHTVDERE
ncbi:hypothetical protein PHYSODRAFT_295232 [Phytophthora sojae]|uniref:Helitron helicase-like domain-containing protein n=1 Tax=Phytophthora sojae (strain P6497) TaxID=1094619 RepID=G4YQQ8_PHYSP|nr:hypothetical protein PHYSODRAFT_295232 [Phytophthora sojae]EGZ30429.1 hypothetical protein PHYSODRAFT_295232 [Phytophthora sojae]|eukprot:XP_009517704.1 hypothetical protein PHYSODRAFT_295232 [Phytophthora sojae]